MAFKSLLSLALLLSVASADVPVYGQCGGTGYTGSTVCVTGAVCTSYNPYYYQCVPGKTTTSAQTSTSAGSGPGCPAKPTTRTTSSVQTSTSASSGPGCPAKPTTRSTATPSKTATSISSAPASTGTGVKYLITFGDSYSQTGFNISSTKPSAANPLGNPALPGWTASGGFNWVGLLVSKYNTSLTLSYNFAYGGATTDSALVKPFDPSVLSFVNQVTKFSNSIATHPSYAPWTAENTAVGVWIGVNDVGNTYSSSNVSAILDAVMKRYFQQLQIIYDAGARNFFLLSCPPINETPMMLQYSDAVRAAEAAVITKYNDMLASNLATFVAANSGVTAQVIATSVPFQTAIDHPTAHGAPNATCYNSDGKSCLWFNNYHPGVAINDLVAQQVATALNGTIF